MHSEKSKYTSAVASVYLDMDSGYLSGVSGVLGLDSGDGGGGKILTWGVHIGRYSMEVPGKGEKLIRHMFCFQCHLCLQLLFFSLTR